MTDLGYCPYYARHHNLPGHSPTAICAGIADCWQQGEPICVTGEPAEGWPSIIAAFGDDVEGG